MHRFLSTGGLWAALVALGVTACQSRQPAPAASAAAAPRLVGRTLADPNGGQRLAWSVTQVVASFTGDSIAVEMADVPEPTHPIGNVYDAIVDGRPPKVIAIHPAQRLYPLADGLGAGPHFVVLIKRTEAAVGETIFYRFVLAPGERLLPPPVAPSRHLEVIGDSISAGYGNEGADANCTFTPLTENGDMAYGPMAARAVGADVAVIAQSGHGLIRNRDLTTTGLVPELYRRTVPSDAKVLWQPRGAVPDAVVINLGTNDFAPGLPDLGQFEKAYLSLIADVRRNAPKARIFVALGPMLSDAIPPHEQHLTAARQVLHHVVAQRVAQGDNRVSFIEFAMQDGRRGFGCDWHPNLATHAAMAAQLADALRSTLHW